MIRCRFAHLAVAPVRSSMRWGLSARSTLPLADLSRPLVRADQRRFAASLGGGPLARPIRPNRGSPMRRSVGEGGGRASVRMVSPLEHAPQSRDVHHVVPRETLWSIANVRLGSALRWKELAELNYGVRQPDGGALGQDHWICPGWTLTLPSRALGDPAEASSGPATAGARADLLADGWGPSFATNPAPSSSGADPTPPTAPTPPAAPTRPTTPVVPTRPTTPVVTGRCGRGRSRCRQHP